MPCDSSRAPPRRIARGLLAAGIGAGVLGLVFLGAKAHNTYQYTWQPLKIALPASPGEATSGTFVAERDDVYEVALELEATLPEWRLLELASAPADEFPADVGWRVASEGRMVAQGGSDVPVYVSTGGRTRLGQIRRWVFSNPFHRGRGSAVRVVGRFRAEAGRRYDVTVRPDALAPEFAATNPRLVLQLSRQLWERHTDGMLTVAYWGLGFLAASMALLAAWAGLSWVTARRAGSRAP